MKYVNSVALAGALVWLVGCATAPRAVVTEPVGPGPLAGSPGRGDGSLVIYSARAPADVDVNIAEWRYNNDFGRNDFVYEPAYTDYTIYAQNGEVFKRVSNARSMNDAVPTVVALPPGRYKVDAEAVDCDSSPVRVLLDRGDQPWTNDPGPPGWGLEPRHSTLRDRVCQAAVWTDCRLARARSGLCNQPAQRST